MRGFALKQLLRQQRGSVSAADRPPRRVATRAFLVLSFGGFQIYSPLDRLFAVRGQSFWWERTDSGRAVGTNRVPMSSGQSGSTSSRRAGLTTEQEGNVQKRKEKARSRRVFGSTFFGSSTR